MKLQNKRHKQLLLCGGAAGHLMHLYDNQDLTFNDLKDALTQAASGELEEVTEKFDGVNLVFTWSKREGIRAARSGGDIKSGGMSPQELTDKFKGRGNVETAFKVGFKVLEQAVSSLPDKVKQRVFGSNGTKWYSIEIIYSGLEKTINYDADYVVFHGHPVFVMQRDGSVQKTDDSSGMDTLKQYIDKMQSAITAKSWQVRGPALMRLKKLSDGNILQHAIDRIEQVQSEVGVSDSDTISDYIRARAQETVTELDLTPKVSAGLVSRLMGDPGCPTLTQLKKLAPSKSAEIRNLVSNELKLKNTWISPIEQAVHEFAVEVLKGLKSSLIADSEAEVKRLRDQVQNAIDTIESSGDEAAITVLRKQMQKLKSIENIASPMEGIVFVFKGNTYKFTGAFAPAHQIVSMLTFGRVAQQQQRESYEQNAEIPTALRKKLWPVIQEDLRILSLKDVDVVGSVTLKSIDVVTTTSDCDRFVREASHVFGSENVERVTRKHVTIKWPSPAEDDLESVRLNVSFGDPNFVKWIRPLNVNVSENSKRFALLAIILEDVALDDFASEQGEYERTKYTLDFDGGLYKDKQTCRGIIDKRDNLPKKLRTWRTVKRTFVTSDPKKIVEIIFGDNTKVDNTMTVDGIINIAQNSSRLVNVIPKIAKIVWNN